MRLEDINIRDPYMLLHEGTYYLYGTRSATCWGPAEGFDGYRSEDLKEWDGPYEIFRRPEGFWADRCFWAPECVYADGMFYFVTTFGSETQKKGIQILRSADPLGPFELWSDGVVTPKDWCCIDGTVVFREAKPYLMFSHSFEDIPDGDMCLMELTADLRAAASEPVTVFQAKDAPWAVPVPFAREEFGMDGDVYFTDGPTVCETGDGETILLWSSWGGHGYSVGRAVSESGNLAGPWKHDEQPLFENGGHGMLFRSKEGELYYMLHYPNDIGKEHPVLHRVSETVDESLD